MRKGNSRIRAACVAALLVFGLPAEARCGEAVPTDSVEVVILRLDYLTYRCEGYHRTLEAYRKVLAPEGFARAGNVYYLKLAAGDFGSTELVSRLTGKRLVYASTVWAGTGRWGFPPESTFVSPCPLGAPAPAPRAMDFVALFGSSRQAADLAWTNARRVDAVRDLASRGLYEVVLFDHFYSVGVGDPATAEWIVVASARPPAPRETEC